MTTNATVILGIVAELADCSDGSATLDAITAACQDREPVRFATAHRVRVAIAKLVSEYPSGRKWKRPRLPLVQRVGECRYSLTAAGRMAVIVTEPANG